MSDVQSLKGSVRLFEKAQISTNGQGGPIRGSVVKIPYEQQGADRGTEAAFREKRPKSFGPGRGILGGLRRKCRTSNRSHQQTQHDNQCFGGLVTPYSFHDDISP